MYFRITERKYNVNLHSFFDKALHTHYAHLKPLGDGSQARHKGNPLFTMYLRDVTGRKKRYIFRSAWEIHSHNVESQKAV